MNIKQVATLLNTINKEYTGEVEIPELAEDLSNIVDVGKSLEDNAGQDLTGFFENYARKIIDKVGRTIIVDRTYRSTAPDIERDSWSYGGILEKIRVSVNELEDDTTWSLTKGDTPEQFEFNPADMSSKYFDDYTVFMTDISIQTKTLQSAFRSAKDMNRLISAITNRIQMKLTISKDNLIRRTINNLIAEKIAGNKEINLLKLYNDTVTTPITAETAIYNPDFLRFAVFQIFKYKKMLNGASVLFGDEDYVNFTPDDKMKMVLLDVFAKSSEVFMESDIYHNELVSLGNNFQTVPFWQGSGTDTEFPFSTLSSINVKTASDGTTVETDGIVGIIFDIDACAVCLEDEEVTSAYAANGRFVNYFYYVNARYLNDLAENVIVFTIKDSE